MHQPTVKTAVTHVYMNLCATAEHLHRHVAPCLCPGPCVVLCLFLCLDLCACLCRGNGGSCDDCVQDSDPCVVSVAKHAGDVFASGCVHCAPVHSRHPCCVADRFHDDVGGGGDGDGCCYDGGGYGPGGYSVYPPHPHPPHSPPRPPSLQAGASVQACGCNPC